MDLRRTDPGQDFFLSLLFGVTLSVLFYCAFRVFS